MWVAFAQGARVGARQFSVMLLAGCVLLVWLAAGYFARRLALPLRQLAASAPALVRGEDATLASSGVPREVRELQSVLLRASGEVREAAAERQCDSERERQFRLQIHVRKSSRGLIRCHPGAGRESLPARLAGS